MAKYIRHKGRQEKQTREYDTERWDSKLISSYMQNSIATISVVFN